LSEFDFEPVRGLPASLPEGETLLWQGHPEWRSLALRAFHVGHVAVYFAALAAWAVGSAWAAGTGWAGAFAAAAWVPAMAAAAIALLGMTGYFTGVVRAPLTAVIIISETTASRGLMMPLLASALVADFAGQLVCKERLYHGLSRRFALGDPDKTASPRPS